MKQHDKVSIRPQVTMLSVLKYLEYETWFALAEFVDNSIASYLINVKRLNEIEGPDFKLIVSIEITEPENKITTRDNADGINKEDYPRAFRAAEIPPDTLALHSPSGFMLNAANE